MLVIAYCLLKRKEEYKELGVNYFDQLNAEGDLPRFSLTQT